MISPICDKCRLPLEDFGGLAFSPPEDNVVEKFHLCEKCWELFKLFLKEKNV